MPSSSPSSSSSSGGTSAKRRRAKYERKFLRAAARGKPPRLQEGAEARVVVSRIRRCGFLGRHLRVGPRRSHRAAPRVRVRRRRPRAMAHQARRGRHLHGRSRRYPRAPRRSPRPGQRRHHQTPDSRRGEHARAERRGGDPIVHRGARRGVARGAHARVRRAARGQTAAGATPTTTRDSGAVHRERRSRRWSGAKSSAPKPRWATPSTSSAAAPPGLEPRTR